MYNEGRNNIVDNIHEKLVSRGLRSDLYEKNSIKRSLTTLVVMNPFSTIIDGEEMFRITHMITNSLLSPVKHIHVDNLKKKNINIYMDTNKAYHIFIDGKRMDTYLCPPGLESIATAVWWNKYGNDNKGSIMDHCSQTKEILQEISKDVGL